MARPVTLATLVEVYKWTPENLEYKLIREACGKPGQTDAAIIVNLTKLDNYLKTTKQGVFVSSKTLFTAEQRLLHPATPTIRIVKSTPAWQKDADSNADKMVSLDELKAYYTEGADGTAAPSVAKNHTKITDQRVALIRHQIAKLTGGTDYLAIRAPKTGPAPAPEALREYYQSIYDPFLRQPRLVAYHMSNADLATRTQLVRKKVEKFFNDPQLLAQDAQNGTHHSQILDNGHSWYAAKYSPFKDANNKPLRDDRGHQWPYNDYADREGAIKTFGSLNMSGQTSQLNQGPWEMYEAAVHETIEGIDFAETDVFVSNLFIASDGQPQTEAGRTDSEGNLIPGSQLVWYGPGKDRKPGDAGYGEERFAQPTDCVKAWLVRLPDGKFTAMAVRMPNTWDVPRNKYPDPNHPELGSRHDFVQAGVISVDEFERLSGYDIALPDGSKPKLEAATNGAAALLPYLRNDLSANERRFVRVLFPTDAVLPAKLDPAQAPVTQEDSEEEADVA